MPILVRRDTLSLFSLRTILLFFSGGLGVLLLTIFLLLKFQQNTSSQQQVILTRSVRDDINRHLEISFSEACRALAKQDGVLQVFSDNGNLPMRRVTLLLNSFREILGANLIYILDSTGTVIASTPSEQGETLNGNNYKFRPYFTEAMKGGDYRYAALGVTTGKRGIYFSSPIKGKKRQVLGVAVIKGGLTNIDKILQKAAAHGPAALLSRDGVVFASSENSWLFHTSSPLEENKKRALVQSGQFAQEPLDPLPIQLDNRLVTFKEDSYTSHSLPIGLHEWSVVTMIPKKSLHFIIILACLTFTVPAFFFFLKVKHFYNELHYKERIHKQNDHLIQLNKEMKKEIEERKETEKKLTEVSQQELQYRLLFEQSKDAITIVTEDGCFVEANRTFLSMMDFTREEVMTMKAKDFWVNQDDRLIWLDLMKKQGSVMDYQSSQKTRNGTILDLNLTTNATTTKDGKTVYLAILHDITDKLADEKELIAAKTLAEQANLAKSVFLANMSHEIRTPMNGIVGMTNIVLDSELHEEQRNYLEMVSSSADRLLDIINNILDFSKIEAGHLDLEEIGFTIEDKLKELTSLMTIKSRNNNVALTTNMASDVPAHLIGDPTKLMQVLINLTNNGIKFTRNGTVTINVKLQKEISSSRALLWFGVRDTGIGVPLDKRSAIFESFSQADTSTTRQYGGTGLGLTISSQLCRLMGGEIGLESNEKQGSLFWFTAAFNLPVQTETPQDLKHGKVMSSELAREDIFQDIKVLLAEDDLINRTLARAVLEKARLKVTTVNNGQEAVVHSVNTIYDLILMDIQMPEMDGYEATAAIRQREKHSSAHIPIIAMTAHAIKGDREKCLSAGMDDYIPKPIDPTELYAAIERQLLNRVLVADTDPISPRLVGRIFSNTGWQVTFVENINQCIWECNNSNFDLIIIDILMPGVDISRVKQIINNRQEKTGKHTNITVLCDIIDEELPRACLSIGIDDFLERPITKERVTTLISDLKIQNTFSPHFP
jgi:PAS domain S-box-containing protein